MNLLFAGRRAFPTPRSCQTRIHLAARKCASLLLSTDRHPAHQRRVASPSVFSYRSKRSDDTCSTASCTAATRVLPRFEEVYSNILTLRRRRRDSPLTKYPHSNLKFTPTLLREIHFISTLFPNSSSMLDCLRLFTRSL